MEAVRAAMALTEPLLPPRLESELAAAQTTAVVVVDEIASQDVTTKQSPPGELNTAAWAAAALPGQAPEV